MGRRTNIIDGFSIFADAILRLKVSGEWFTVDRLAPEGDDDDDGYNPTVMTGTYLAASHVGDSGHILDEPVLRFRVAFQDAGTHLLVVPVQAIEAYELDQERL